MDLSNCTIGYGVTGSFCTMEKSKSCLRRLARQGATIVPIFSYNVQKMDTRFGRAKENIEEIQDITKNKGIFTIDEAEPIGPKNILSAMIIAPCTGNTLAKLANGITDTPVTMAAKAHLRNGRPLCIAFTTNDGLSVTLQNVGALLTRKNVYFVPFHQDDPLGKPNSLAADFTKLEQTFQAAWSHKQLQPLLTP